MNLQGYSGHQSEKTTSEKFGIHTTPRLHSALPDVMQPQPDEFGGGVQTDDHPGSLKRIQQLN